MDNYYTFLDFEGSEIENKKKLIKSHLPVEFIPWNEKTKYIFIGQWKSYKLNLLQIKKKMLVLLQLICICCNQWSKNRDSKIFLARSPKDCLVSFYYHTLGFDQYYNFKDGKFNDFFKLFVKGECDYGNYFEVYFVILVDNLF